MTGRNTRNHGRYVSMVTFPPAKGEFRSSWGPSEDEVFVLQNEFHGDHDEDWVVVLDKNNTWREIRRYNVRYLESITWAPDLEKCDGNHPMNQLCKDPDCWHE